jgi:hypothetical protein
MEFEKHNLIPKAHSTSLLCTFLMKAPKMMPNENESGFQPLDFLRKEWKTVRQAPFILVVTALVRWIDCLRFIRHFHPARKGCHDRTITDSSRIRRRRLKQSEAESHPCPKRLEDRLPRTTEGGGFAPLGGVSTTDMAKAQDVYHRWEQILDATIAGARQRNRRALTIHHPR